MPLAKINVKLENVDRKVEYGTRDVLQLIDKDSYEVLATIRKWGYQRLNPLQKGAPELRVTFDETPLIKDLLPICRIAINGLVYDVTIRTGPTMMKDKQWIFKLNPTNEFVP